jgi:hypothetical protein
MGFFFQSSTTSVCEEISSQLKPSPELPVCCVQDNVAIQHVMASYLPGHYFPEGRHHVLYQATDADGNRARQHIMSKNFSQ